MNRTLFFRIIAISLFVAGTLYTRAQTPPHPNSGGAPTNGNTVGSSNSGGAPIGSGTYILFMLAAAYGGRKVYRQRTEVADENL
jgi:hypothetical protein